MQTHVNPLPRPSAWDHSTLPYSPVEPVFLFWLKPGDPCMRVVVPNALGEYHQLIPGMPYYELPVATTGLCELRPPHALADARCQVEWDQLPVHPLEHLRNFVKS
jgi:hypothetical protein